VASDLHKGASAYVNDFSGVISYVLTRKHY